MLEHGMEDRQQLGRASHQGDHVPGFACRHQPFVELLEERVVSGSDQAVQVQRPARPASPRRTAATHAVRVAVEGRYGYQIQQPLGCDGSKPGQLGWERSRQRWPCAEHADQHLVLTLGQSLAGGPIEIQIGVVEFLFQPAAMRPDALRRWPRRGSRNAVLLGDKHRDDLLAVRQDRYEMRGFLTGERVELGEDDLHETCQGLGVEDVDFGETSGGSLW
jgi:hypothetical protein